MMKQKYVTLALILLATLSVKADEGMWLLQLMQEQNLADKMKQQGLQLEVNDIYNPQAVSLKDAVGIFGRGCTGEIISADGLVLTNHHCGYDAIQQHSSVEHDYLTDGFWAKSKSEELVTPGLGFTFIERIVDITDSVNARIARKEITETKSFTHSFLDKLAQEMLVASDLNGKSGISAQALPFYAGNKYYLFFKKKYSDVRMVAAPPSSIGKFGGETDNWMWPRHTGDFSVFRIYGDANGEPADYDKANVPLKSKKHFAISLKGLGEGDYAMVMGFPGSTNRYLTASEIRQEMTSINEPRIKVREARQNVLREEMKQSDKVRIQYASKFASSSNYWKNAIGMNEAIVENKVIEDKQLQEQQFAAFAATQNNEAYKSVIAKIDAVVAQNAPLQYEWTAYTEAFFTGIEFGFPYKVCELLADAYKAKNDSAIAEHTQTLKDIFAEIHNKDYDHEVDRKVMKTLLPLYKGMVTADKLPEIYAFINKKYKGDFNKFVDNCYNRSIFANEANFNKFINKPSRKAIEKDPMTPYVESKHARLAELRAQFGALNDSLDLLHKIYVRGLGEMKQPSPAYPDANFTLRLTYGNVKSYRPKDGIHYNYFTTMRGIMEKEDPNNREFNVPAKLKELYNNKDFGRYAMKNGEMPVCFTSTNDITGGNSGSPVINARGELIGTAFDGNWESLSGDINFDNDLQRCINVDIRYVLFVIEKLGGCKNLIDEMTIVE